jgi:hypothetical protein
MEVHHDPKVENKNFEEYFLEFIMIFLAVTLGFFGENTRDHFDEQKTRQKYLESLKMELIHNKIVFKSADSLYTTRLPVEDSIVKRFIEKKENEDIQVTARLITTSRSQYSPAIEILAYTQLINSGGLKYLDNRLRDPLSKDENLIEAYKTYNTVANNYIMMDFPGITSIEDLSDMINPDPKHTFTMLPYSELTDKERREISNYYTFHSIRTYQDRENIRNLINTQDHLIKMVKKEINSTTLK